jgi:hypothetical protein
MDILKVWAFIKSLINENFHGKIILTIQEGLIVHFEERRSRKF